MRIIYGVYLSVTAAFLTAAPVVASVPAGTIAVEAGPIWSQSDANKKCPEVAKTNGGVWNGNWQTTVPGRMSVCELRFSAARGKYVVEAIEAGPIWNQQDAEKKCPQVAKTNGGTWNGNWQTTVPGRMSVCEIRLPVPLPAR